MLVVADGLLALSQLADLRLSLPVDPVDDGRTSLASVRKLQRERVKNGALYGYLVSLRHGES